MQIIFANDGLGGLADLSILPQRQKFRTDHGITDAVQYLLQFRMHLPIGRYQVFYQGLGDGNIDAVHTHMIAVVGTPAQSRLGQILGAHHQPVFLIGHVHQDLGALPGLDVLIGQVVHILRVADIPHMLSARL